MYTNTKKVLVSALLLAFTWGFTPAPAQAASNLEVSGWIPYWSASAGAKDAKKHIKQIDIVNPFAYAVKQDGSLKDVAKLSKKDWRTLFNSARSNDALVIPTMMWSDGSAIHRILSDENTREDHIESIMKAVKKYKFDGVDIDYEGKWAETKDFYSLFLKELKDELDDKILSCTIEARTPPDSLYTTIPDTIRYANDLEAIAEHCDRVNIMTYDQQRADLKLNEEKNDGTYAPLADADWVEKVIKLMTGTIPAEKISLGVATYGHEYEVIVYPNGYREYNKVRALNIPAMLKIAKKYKITPSRNSAGEMGFSYFPSKHGAQFTISNDDIPKNTPSGEIVEAKTEAYVEKTGNPTTFYYASWSDADAIEEKIKLAEQYDLNGIAIFKFDGQEDKAIWNLF